MVRDDQGGDEVNLGIVVTPVYQEFAARYRQHYDVPESEAAETIPYATYTYDATGILIETIAAVSVVDAQGNLVIGRQALAEAVRRTPNYRGVTGIISFDDRGDRQLP